MADFRTEPNFADICTLYNGQLTTHNGQPTTDIARLYELFRDFQPGMLNLEPLNLLDGKC
jgi:hypothetical protein